MNLTAHPAMMAWCCVDGAPAVAKANAMAPAARPAAGKGRDPAQIALTKRRTMMACNRREATGTCLHVQCPYPGESGYECVELIAADDFMPGDLHAESLDGKCEVGQDCIKGCEYSF